MRADPTVSVIVPAYNAGLVIEETLRSALAQTLSEIEVLVVDDGSTDDTVEVVRRVAAEDPRVRLIEQENAGVATARNVAIAAARGTYVAPLDADDVWYPNKLDDQVTRMERGGRDMGMVYSWWVSIDETETIRGSSFPCRVEGNVALCLLYSNFIGNASVPLYRRSAIERVGGYDPALRAQGAQGCEDWDLSLRVAARYDTGVAPGHHVGYRQVPGTMSTDVAMMARSYYAVIDRVRSAWPRVPQKVFRWSEANFASYLASKSYENGEYASAVRWMTLGLRVDPAFVLAPYAHRLVARSLARLGGGQWLDRVIESRRVPPHRYTLEQVDAEWIGTEWTTPWARSDKPFDRIRTDRWKRLLAAEPPVPRDVTDVHSVPKPTPERREHV